MRSELSERNKYRLNRFRFNELRNFCRQYSIWQQAYKHLNSISAEPNRYITFCDGIKSNNPDADPTAKLAIALECYADKIKMLESTAIETDACLGSYILKGITEGINYDTLKARTNIPCGRNIYYLYYHKFLWILNKKRN